MFMDTGAGRHIKVVARYQQFRAAGRIVERLRQGATPMARSGVVWHTQGSGESPTMVFVARMLRASRDLNDFTILLVNDRIDLAEQLGKTATLIGGKVNVIENTQALRRHLAPDSSDINMVMVHKLQERQETLKPRVADALGTYRAMPAADPFRAVNASERIILMIDEAHRTQGSDLGDNLFEAFPNATRIALTGARLSTERHGGKKTVKRFVSNSGRRSCVVLAFRDPAPCYDSWWARRRYVACCNQVIQSETEMRSGMPLLRTRRFSA
jgi:type I restriction enzyme R subunit